MDCIMRPVYNRPEMLKLSLEYEIAARKKSNLIKDEFITVFVVEYGSPEETIKLIEAYPYKKLVIERSSKQGLTINILTGMQECFSKTDDYVIYIEDDVLIHSTYFDYMAAAMELYKNKNVSVFASCSSNVGTDINAVYEGHHYAALAPLITKYFFNKYINPHIIPEYYLDVNRGRYVVNLNNKYKNYWGGLYKYRDSTHNEQAGLINRLVDVALIEENIPMIMPYVDRQIHIGYFGKNRPGGKIPGKTFDERVSNLREIIKSAATMYAMSFTKQYNDYKVFNTDLDKWGGVLYVK